jgi:hypothetical protein
MAAPNPNSDHLTQERTCQECGMLLDQAGEFHPYTFCVLKKAGRDPWQDIGYVVDFLLGVRLPAKPPLVRDLPLRAPSGLGEPDDGPSESSSDLGSAADG